MYSSKERTDAMRTADLIAIRDKEGVVWGNCLHDTFFAEWDNVDTAVIGGTALAIPLWLLDTLENVLYLDIYVDSARYEIELAELRKVKLSWTHRGYKCLIADKSLFKRRLS